ncbi:MAG: Rep [Cressdnaviricota sp.]|nr:MAG: Rep [Cressdnaviricota sp.]
MDSENKYRNWVFTWNAFLDPKDGSSVLPDSSSLKTFLEFHCEQFIYQKEKGEETSREHLQGAFRTKIRMRKSTLLNLFKQEDFAKTNNLVQYLTVERMCGTWTESLAYCSKKETSVGEPITSSNLWQYDGGDVNFLEDKEKRHPWQNQIINEIYEANEIDFKVPDDRSITWICDTKGNTGKSKFVKYLCSTNTDIVKITFGTAPQLRSAIISIGRKKVYIIDMPRTLADDDSIPSLISTLEDLKNGFVVSVFYGKYQQLLMEPPHVIIMSNQKCPTNMMSDDRWVKYGIDNDTKELYDRYDFI